MADLEFFLAQQDPVNPILLDEIHQSADPSLILKIAADEYPALRILATGFSTLQATKKFRDSLTGRKYSIHLVRCYGVSAFQASVSAILIADCSMGDSRRCSSPNPRRYPSSKNGWIVFMQGTAPKNLFDEEFKEIFN